MLVKKRVYTKENRKYRKQIQSNFYLVIRLTPTSFDSLKFFVSKKRRQFTNKDQWNLQ